MATAANTVTLTDGTGNIGNFAVTGETLILTDQGYIRAYDITEPINIWNGERWVGVNVVKSDRERHIITVIISNGITISCTHNQNFITGIGPLKHAERITAHKIQPSTVLRKTALPIINSSFSFKSPYLHGALCAFGHFTKEKMLMDWTHDSFQKVLDKTGHDFTSDPELEAPYAVPVNSSIDVKIQWLTGLLDSRSNVSALGVIFMNIREDFLQLIRLMLSTLNVHVSINRSASRTINSDEQNCVTVCNYTLLIPWLELVKLQKYGLQIDAQPQTFFSHYDVTLSVVETVDIGRLAHVYTFQEPNIRACVLNGILMGDCD
jgi:hypothetical protein